jgi:hypothetical protein
VPGARWLAAAWCLVPAVALAQTPPGLLADRLYVDPGTLVGSTRIVALGGAFVGVAEGAEAMASNLAAISHHAPALGEPWDVDASVSWFAIQLGSTRRFDYDNSGSANGAAGTSQLSASLLVQFTHFGLGTYVRFSNYSYCTVDCAAADQISVQFVKAAVAASLALHHDDLLLAVGYFGLDAGFGYQGQTWQYAGNGIEVDALYRPLGEPYRLGLSIKPQVVAPFQPAGQSTFIAGRQLYSAAVAPSILSLGMSYRLGPGASAYNRLAPIARRARAQDVPGEPLPPELAPGTPTGRWLLTVQADLIQSAENAVALRALINQTPEPVAVSGALEPRLGVEHETLPGRLRLLAGSYLEPSSYASVSPRIHGTGGFEVRLFHAWQDWAVSGSFDFARLYYNLGLSVGIFHAD